MIVKKNKIKYKINCRFSWQKGKIWNWYLLPTLVIIPLQRELDYHSIYIAIEFLRFEFAIGLIEIGRNIK